MEADLGAMKQVEAVRVFGVSRHGGIGEWLASHRGWQAAQVVREHLGSPDTFRQELGATVTHTALQSISYSGSWAQARLPVEETIVRKACELVGHVCVR